MVKEETWGVSLDQAEGFFQSQPDVDLQEDGYSFRSCRITLNALESGLLGKLPFPRTQLRIEGPEEEVRVIHRRFLIQFLTAGG